MDCKTAKSMVNAYIDGNLTDKECTDFLKHVKLCPDCYDELETYFIVDYSLKSLGEESAGRSYDMQKALKDDIHWNERRIWRTELTRIVTIIGVVYSEILIILTCLFKFHPDLARTIANHISVLFPG